MRAFSFSRPPRSRLRCGIVVCAVSLKMMNGGDAEGPRDVDILAFGKFSWVSREKYDPAKSSYMLLSMRENVLITGPSP
jgi:hypothetical protein